MSSTPLLGLGRPVADPAGTGSPSDKATTLTPGALLEGRVLGQQGASTLVRVDGRVLAFTLTGSWAAGTRLSLQYLGSGPDGLRFLLRTAAASGSGPEQVRLSADARSLQSFLAEAPEQLHSPTPLLPRSETNPLPIAAALQRGLQQTGLFYESHLLAWSQGQWSQTALLQEPQGQLSSLLRGAVLPSSAPGGGASGVITELAGAQPPAEGAPPRIPSAATGQSSMAQVDNMPQTAQSTHSAANGESVALAEMPSAVPGQGLQRLASDTYRQVAVISGNTGSTAIAQHLATAGQLGPLVGQQLQTLAQQQLQWSGALWPGQWLEWNLRRSADDAPREGDGGSVPADAESLRWDSTLRLQLPCLGSVEARLRLQGQRLWLDVQGDRAETLQAAYGELHQALQALGLEVLHP
ncbi:MAG: flagellar hook-length control protein FliK [Acidithiobacillus sp.]